jgi:hypothetical protein
MSLLLSLLLACAGDKPAGDAGGGDTGAPPAADDSAPPGETAPPGEGGGAGGPDDSAVSGDTDTGPVYTEAQVENAGASLHETFRSVVVVEWDQRVEATAWVEFSVDEGRWRATPPKPAAVGEQRALLLGVPYGVEVTWRVVNDGLPGADGPLAAPEETTETGAVPAALPLPAAVSGDASRWDPSGEFLLMSVTEAATGFSSIYDDWWVLILDRQGRVVWAWENHRDYASLHPRVSRDGGALLIDQNTYWGAADGGAASHVVAVKLDGTEVARWQTPGLHHPFTDLPDGSLAWGAATGRGDETLEILDPEGTRRMVWSCEETVRALGAWGPGTYCGSNTLSWDESRGSFLFSFYSLFTVFEIDPDAGEALRWFGALDGAWAFEPAESAFWWQHGVHYTEAGTLLVSVYEDATGSGTVAREYALDEAAETLEEIWSFGVGDGLFGQYMGEAHRLPGGNTLHNTGSLPRLREATPEGEVVWDVQWEGERWIGRSTFIPDLYALAP